MSKNGTDTQDPGTYFRDRFSDEHLRNSLDRLLNRMDTLENALEKIAVAMDKGPGMVSMAADIVDEGYRNLAGKGVVVEERLQVALSLLERLTEPSTAERLHQLLDLADKLPGLSSMAMDIIDDTQKQYAAQGIDIEGRLKGALQLAERVTAPATLEQVEALLGWLEKAPGLVAMATDMIDEQAARMDIDPGAIGQIGGAVSKAVREITA